MPIPMAIAGIPLTFWLLIKGVSPTARIGLQNGTLAQ
jgi:hypothetical protein